MREKMRRHNSDSVGNNGESSSSPNAQMEMSYTAVQPGIYCKEFWSYWINPTRMFISTKGGGQETFNPTPIFMKRGDSLPLL